MQLNCNGEKEKEWMQTFITLPADLKAEQHQCLGESGLLVKQTTCGWSPPPLVEGPPAKTNTTYTQANTDERLTGALKV